MEYRSSAFSSLVTLSRWEGPVEPTAIRADPDAVKDVLEGKRTTANAAWWGFDEYNAKMLPGGYSVRSQEASCSQHGQSVDSKAAVPGIGLGDRFRERGRHRRL